MEPIVIEANQVSVRFNLAKERTDSIKEYILKLIRGKLNYTPFEALKNVSFQIRKGESVGIVGGNGAGKSTLLKCISGIYRPTSGSVHTRGLIAPLIELGAGFDGDLTARENIFLNGAVMGLDKKFVEEKFDEIVAFSELEDFLDVAIKNFSSGMTARLGFSLASIIEPEILIVDEILGVGDAAFQKKCSRKMEELLRGQATMLLVSHDIGQVRALCSRALWLRHGQLIMDGSANEVCDEYENWSHSHTAFEKEQEV